MAAFIELKVESCHLCIHPESLDSKSNQKPGRSQSSPAASDGDGQVPRPPLGNGARELDDASTSSPGFPDPPGFTRSAPNMDDATTARQRKEAEGTRKWQKAWEVAQTPFKNLMMMGFMMWMAGSTVQLFSIGIVFSPLWQPFIALRSVQKVFEPFKDPRVDTLAPKLLFIALNLAAMGLGVWKLNTLALLPTNTSDWVSSLSPAREVEYAGGGLPLY